MTTPLQRYEYYAARIDRINAARMRQFWANVIVVPVFVAMLMVGLWFGSSKALQFDAQTLAVESSVYYRTCADARAAGKAPIYEGQPGYRPGLDGDDDGIACEPFHPLYEP